MSTEPGDGPADPNGRDLSSAAFLARKIARHVRWARTHGIAHLIEEDDLHPVRRWRQRTHRHRRSGPPISPGDRRTVLIVGLQRSGTNMLLRSFAARDDTELRNENDRELFDRYRLRSVERLVAVTSSSPAPVVVVKPLIDSHRTTDLLDALGPSSRAVWLYRDPDGRARSSMAKFGDHDRQVVLALAAGRDDLWQSAGLDPRTVATALAAAGPDPDPATASAVVWYLRNRVVTETGLDRRDDVLVVSYEDLTGRAPETVDRVCDHVAIRREPAMATGIAPRHAPRPPLVIAPPVRELCDDLLRHLDTISAAASPDARR